jgi:PAS domain S-box-containing protein
MSIKNILKINSRISVIIIVLSLVFLALSVHEKNKADEDNDIAEQIHTTILERTVLRDEYLLHREKHLWVRWTAKTEEIRQLLTLAEKRFINPSDSDLIEQVREDFETTVSLAHKVFETGDKIGSDGEKRLLSRIFVKVYSMIEKINRIEHSAQTSASDAQKKMMVMMVIFIVISVMMAIGNSVVINRTLAKGIQALLKGSSIIGSGDLDYRISIKGNNELSDLAKAVNDMAYRLKETHISVDNLRAEIVNRKLAEEKLKTTLYSIGDAVMTTDKHGMITQMNFVAEYLTGWTEKEALGKPLAEVFRIINEYTRKEVENPADRVLREGGIIGLANHTLLISKDGTEHPIADSGAPIRNDSREIIGVVLVFRDQSKEREAENALRASEAKARAVLESLAEGVVFLNTEGVVESANLAVREILGRGLKELADPDLDPRWRIIRPDGSLFPVEEQPAILALRTGQTVRNVEMGSPHLDGSIRWLSVNAQLVREPDGTIQGVVASFFDITERKKAEEKFAESLERLNLATHAAAMGIWDWHIKDNQLIWDDRMYELYGIRKDDFGNVYEDWFNMLHPDDRMKNSGLSEEVRSGKKEFDNNFRIILPDGTIRIIRSCGMVVFDPKGNPIRMTGVNFDITKQKQAENELHVSLEKYKVLFDSFPLGITITDNAGQILEGNQKSVELLGISKEEHARRLADGEEWHIIRPDGTLMPPDEYASVRALKDNCIVENVEMGIVKGRGQVTWISVTAAPIPLEGYGVAITYSDITQKKEAEFALNKLTAELEQRVAERSAEVQDLYNNAPCGYHSLDENGIFVHINDTELNWLGYTRDEIIGKKSVTDIFTEKSRLIFKQNFPIFKERGWVKDLEFEMIRKDGSIFPVILSATAIRDSEGNYFSSRSTLFDITERKKAEQAIARKSEELILANAALEKAARLKDEFLAGMSHELRTPLTGVISLSEALLEEVYGPLNEKQQKALKTVGESGQHLLELINDVLDLSKVEAGQLTLQIEKCSVSDICHGSLQLIKGMANKKKQKVVFDMSPASVSTEADPRRLKQIIVNLLSNAVKFTPDGGEIGLHVEGDMDSQLLRFTVSDTGIGIEPDDLPKLFMPFVQLDSSLSRQYSGTGLGLSLVRSMTELHGGKVSVESEVGKGSRFTVTLPWIAPAQMLSDTSDATLGQIPVNEQQTVNSLILIVEDNDINIETYSDYLQIKGYDVIVARDGAEGIQKAQEIKPDLILMDIQMPGMDGWEAIGHIRADADPKVASVPIIALTALAMPGDREKCIAAGAKDYLSKPVKLKHLLETIEKHLKRD